MNTTPPTPAQSEKIDIAGMCDRYPEGRWLEDKNHENGNYQCKCLDCGKIFVGHKRRIQCRVCATKPAQSDTPRTDALIDELANAFLRWPLPDSVCADPCAAKQGTGRTGTNLLSFIEARKMMQDIVAPALAAKEAEVVLLTKRTHERREVAQELLVRAEKAEAEVARIKAIGPVSGASEADVYQWLKDAQSERDQLRAEHDEYKKLFVQFDGGAMGLALHLSANDQLRARVAELEQDKARLATLSQLRQDYIKYLHEADSQTAAFLHVHGWRYSDELIDRGNQLRRQMAEAQAAIDAARNTKP